MDSEDGEEFIRKLASLVRTREKALANALRPQSRETSHGSSQQSSSANNTDTTPAPQTSTPGPGHPSSSSTKSPLATALSLGSSIFTSQSVKPVRLALTPHHLFYLLSQFEGLGIQVGPMNVRTGLVHDTSSVNYVSFLSQGGTAKGTRSEDSDVRSKHSISGNQNTMSGALVLWKSIGVSGSASVARTQRQKTALEADLKYLYSAFTKIPCLILAPDGHARLIRGYEEFPFDTAVSLHSFKNVQALEVKDIDFRLLFGWDRLADQLRSLTLRRASLDDPSDILINIVWDDVDKRRRRSSKVQLSPTSTWLRGSRPQRSNTPIKTEAGTMAPNEVADNDQEREEASSPPGSLNKGERSLDDLFQPESNSGKKAPKHYRHHRRDPRPGSEIHLEPPSSSHWLLLRHLSLADNSLTTVSRASLVPLWNTLKSLDLSYNLFTQIPDGPTALTALRALNLSNCMIESLHSLNHNPLPAVTTLNLRANRLWSLAGLEKLLALERLDLRDNRLADPMEIARLTGNPDIREIYVQGNPFVRTHKDHRVAIFNLFRRTPGYTEDIVVDGTGPTYSERRQLVDRVAIPESVPVVKPQAPEVMNADGLATQAAISEISTDLSQTPRRAGLGTLTAQLRDEDLDARNFVGKAILQRSPLPEEHLRAMKAELDVDSRIATAMVAKLENEGLSVRDVSAKVGSLAAFSDSGYASRQFSLVPPKVDMDVSTVYSDISNISVTTNDGYKKEFVNQLITAIDLRPSDASALQSSMEDLVPIFQSFARKLHGEARSPMQREASVFINKHKKDIVELFGDRLDGEAQVEQSSRIGGGMPVNDVSKWIEEIQDADFMHDLSEISKEEFLASERVNEDGESNQDDGRANRPTDFVEHWAFIQETGAYKWLLSRLHRQTYLTAPVSNLMYTVGQTLYSQIWSKASQSFRQMSRNRTPGHVKMTFSLKWDPVKFLRDQEFSIPPQEALWQTICLTGSWEEAQATSCELYMEQTWPLTNGPIMSLLTDLVSASEETKCSQTLDPLDGFSLVAMMQNGTCVIEANGGLDFVSEIGEQLGWLGSALRSSPVEDGVIACSPKITSLEIQPNGVHEPSVRVAGSCSLDFSLEPVIINSHEPGFCWSNLFRNPVLVTGYPVPRRTSISPGLEMPINMMAGLVRSRRISSFCGRRMIKGFCTILMPMLITLDSVVWHLIFNPNGTRISYVDARLREVNDEASRKVTIQDIESKRHILGWCSSIVDYTGHPQANFGISASGLRSPPSSTNFEKVYLEAGDQVVGGVSVAIAKRDKPARFQARVDYIEMVDWISSQAVVFYDVSDRRAWLVDGASAILHLVRASLAHDATRPAFKSSWLFDSNKLNEASSHSSGRLNSVEVLVDEDNRSLPVYMKSKKIGECSLFQDRAEDILHYLQQMMDHQSEVEMRDGLWLRNSFKLRKNLVGFDFYDISTRARELWPRIQYLRETGYGWVDFVRKIKAVTIFGSGFGDLLKPDQSIKMCSHWTATHTGQDYLTASLSLLKMLYVERRAPDFDHNEIVRDILWASPCEPFKPCACISHPDVATHSDPVQVFLPKGSKLFPRQPKSFISPCDLKEDGAVVFGHNRYFKIRWPNDGGAPVEGEPAGDAELQPAVTEDTTVGSSVTQRSTNPSVRNESPLAATATTSSLTELTEPTVGTPGSEGEPRKPDETYDDKGKAKWHLTSPLRLLFKQKKLP